MEDLIMSVECGLTDHRIWIDALASFGTVMATGIALCLAWKASRDQRRERLSGLAIICVLPDATAFLANNTRVDLRFSLYKCELIDSKTEVPSYRDNLKISALTSVIEERWKRIHDGITLSPGERLPIHLTSIVIKEIYVSLVALRVVFASERRTRYWVCRFAGDKAASSQTIRDSTHPHGDWVLEFGGEITSRHAAAAIIEELFAD